MTEGTCAIWGGAVQTFSAPEGYGYHSPRAGGWYVLARYGLFSLRDLDQLEKARLTTWLVDQRRQGVDTPILTSEIIEGVKTAPGLKTTERRVRLLLALEHRRLRPGQTFQFFANAGLPDEVAELLAWTESTDQDDLRGLVGLMESEGLLLLAQGAIGTITPAGYSLLDELTGKQGQTPQAFVAMWFDKSMSAVYERAIEPAVRRAGYVPLRIDRKEHVNKIDDEIVAEIKKSRFLIADFTCAQFIVYGEAEPRADSRGGVYFEAGLAKGLGMDVIWTCRSDCLKKVHFDNRQYAFVVWDDGDLRQFERDLYNRIVAVLGPGPTHGATS